MKYSIKKKFQASNLNCCTANLFSILINKKTTLCFFDNIAFEFSH